MCKIIVNRKNFFFLRYYTFELSVFFTFHFWSCMGDFACPCILQYLLTYTKIKISIKGLLIENLKMHALLFFFYALKNHVTKLLPSKTQGEARLRQIISSTNGLKRILHSMD